MTSDPTVLGSTQLDDTERPNPQERGPVDTIFGPRVPSTRQRIQFFFGIPAEAGWDARWELVQQRQRWARAHYGDKAFEEKPPLDDYTEFDFTDGGLSTTEYATRLQPRDLAKVDFVLNQNEAEHDEHHFVRMYPFCPKCRPAKVIAGLSLMNWMMRNPGRLPVRKSDTELDWDTEIVHHATKVEQSSLYLSLADLQSMPRPEELVEGVLPAKGVGYITGRDRSLKTFLALDICLHVAFMLPHWHAAGPDGEPRGRRTLGWQNFGRFLFAAGEGVTSFGPRINAWLQYQHVKGHGADDVRTADGERALRRDGCQACASETDPDVGHVGHLELADDGTFLLEPGPGQLELDNVMIRRGTPNFFAGGEDYLYMLGLARRTQPDIIVIDTLALAAGSAEQNSTTDMGIVHQRAAALAEASDGLVLVIAHTDKSDTDARGSSVIEDNADFVLHCSRISDAELKVTVAKRKDAADNWSFMLQVEEVETGLGQTSLVLTDWDRELHIPEEPAEDVEEREQLMQVAIRCVRESGVNSFGMKEFAFAGTGMTESTARRRLTEMVERGDLLRTDPGKVRQRITYHLPADRVEYLRGLNIHIAEPEDGHDGSNQGGRA